MSKVLISVDGRVRTVVLNRPEKRNALDADVMRGLIAAFPGDPGQDERVAVLRANGLVFCSGMDLTQDKAALGKPDAIEEMLRAIETYPLPVVAVVQGHAIAGGFELAMHCDFVVANLEAKLGMSLARIGLAPTWFLAKKPMEVAGPVATREILLLGDALPSERMADLGIIARAVAPDQLEMEVAAIVDRLAANAPLSLKAMKRMLVRQMAFRDKIPHDDLNAWVADISDSRDANEGVRARLDRRIPVFTGK